MTLIGNARTAPVCWIPVYRIHADASYVIETKPVLKYKSAASIELDIASGSRRVSVSYETNI
jgi:hypothetical protein